MYLGFQFGMSSSQEQCVSRNMRNSAIAIGHTLVCVLAVCFNKFCSRVLVSSVTCAHTHTHLHQAA